MADKRISQLVERLTTASTDVFPVVYVGATETQKVKASTIYTYIKNTLVSGIIQATTDTDKFLVQDGTEIKYRSGAEVLNDVLPNQSGNAGYVLKTDGSIATWQPDGGASALTLQDVTDNGNTTTNDIVLSDSSLTGIDTLEFDLTPATTTHQEGRVHWNDDLKTLQIDTENSNVQINVGHDTIQRVRNVTGATISKGKVVYINGESGNRPTITLASNVSDATSANTIGVVMSDITNNNNGYIITNGLLQNINTTGLTPGETLYLSTSGNYTNTKPVAPNHLVYIGKVISVGATGSIFVTIQNGYELDELHNVLITSETDGQSLSYQASTGLWVNTDSSSVGSDLYLFNNY
jgi:hypothetical protein